MREGACIGAATMLQPLVDPQIGVCLLRECVFGCVFITAVPVVPITKLFARVCFVYKGVRRKRT